MPTHYDYNWVYVTYFKTSGGAARIFLSYANSLCYLKGRDALKSSDVLSMMTWPRAITSCSTSRFLYIRKPNRVTSKRTLYHILSSVGNANIYVSEICIECHITFKKGHEEKKEWFCQFRSTIEMSKMDLEIFDIVRKDKNLTRW